MKFLLLVLFAGLGLAVASDFRSDPATFDVQYYVDDEGEHVEGFISYDDDAKEELKKKLKERFDEILEKLKDTLEKGKGFREDTIKKLKEIREKLQDLKVDLGDKAKELIEKLKEKAKDYWQKVLDRLGLKESVAYSDDNSEARSLRTRLEELVGTASSYVDDDREVPRDILVEIKRVFQLMEEKNVELTSDEVFLKWAVDYYLKNRKQVLLYALVDAEEEDLAKNLRERFEEILEKIKDAIENRKVLGGNVVAKFREIYNQMKEKSIPFGDKVKEIFEQVKEKATGIWKRILDKINISSDVPARGTGAENLRDRLQELLEKLRDAFKNKRLPERGFIAKLRQIRDEMRNKNVPLGGKLKEFIEKLKENANGVWRRILDRIGQHAPSNQLEIFYEDPKTELGKTLKKHLDEILDKIKDIVENGKTYKEDLVEKAKEIVQKLKDMKEDISDHAKKVLKDIKEKAKDYWRKVLDKLSFDSETNLQAYADEPKSELAKILKKHLDEILDKLKDIVENGRVYKEDLVEKAKEIAQKLRDMRVDIGDHARKVISDLKEKAKDYWKKVLEKLGLKY